MRKIFNFIIIIFSFILCLFSLIAFILIHLDLAKYKFEFNIAGINSYFDALSQYKELFAGTITLIVAYFGIQRFQAAEIANKDKIKLDRYSDWKHITELRMAEVKENCPLFLREFSRIRYNLYSDLYDKQLSINSKKELQLVFDKYFKNLVRAFEEMSKDFRGIGGIYMTASSTYFFDDFYFVFIGCLDKAYEDIYDDIELMYLLNLDPNRLIDAQTYQSAYSRYTGII